MKKKNLTAFALALLLCGSLTACGGNKEGSDLAYVKEKGTLIVGITEF